MRVGAEVDGEASRLPPPAASSTFDEIFIALIVSCKLPPRWQVVLGTGAMRPLMLRPLMVRQAGILKPARGVAYPAIPSVAAPAEESILANDEAFSDKPAIPGGAIFSARCFG